MRVYKYLLGTKGLCVYLQADDDNCVKGYYDASYGVHTDMKSHTGACTTLGRGAVYVTSSKQTIVAKSSTEAEMIAVSDHADCSKRILCSSVRIEQTSYTLSGQPEHHEAAEEWQEFVRQNEAHQNPIFLVERTCRSEGYIG